MEAAATAVSIAWGSGEVPSTSGSLESRADRDKVLVPMLGVEDELQAMEMDDMEAQATTLRRSTRSTRCTK